MTTSIKKEISSLIEEVLKELGQVDHRVPGTGPIHTGFSELPISSTALEHLNHKVEEAYNLVEKALENLDQVVAEMESNGHHPGNLLLIADQVELVADGLAEHLNIDNQPDEPEEKDLEEAKRRKRKKCQCADGKNVLDVVENVCVNQDIIIGLAMAYLIEDFMADIFTIIIHHRRQHNYLLLNRPQRALTVVAAESRPQPNLSLLSPNSYIAH